MSEPEEKITVTVTQEDWDLGKPADNGQCALAQCLKRKFPGLRVGVGLMTATIGGHGYELDVAGRDVVVRFDSRLPIKLPTDVSLRRFC